MWKYIAEIGLFKCPWIELIGEKWMDDDENELDYWRIVSADSVIIIPLQDNELLLPRKIFRPGVGKTTLDFPGGRLISNKLLESTVRNILSRELGINSEQISNCKKVYDKPLLINSSLSSQRLYGFFVDINSFSKNELKAHFSFSLDHYGIEKLLKELECLQCRALLLEFLRIKDSLI